MTAADAVRARIGYATEPVERTIEAGHVRRFCEAIGDPNPRWRAEVPPTFFVALGAESPVLPEVTAYGRGTLNAGDSFEYLAPVAIGETLMVTSRLADVYEKQGSSGPMLFTVWEKEYSRPGGEVVVRIRGTRIRR